MTGGSIYIVIAATFFGFIGLAFILLFPVWRFLHRQERMADDWTDEAVRRRAAERRPPPAGGAGGRGDETSGRP